MYSRTIGDEEHTFGVSGKLIMNALVMYDHQTRTLWSQFLRKGVEGELEGVELDVFPVTQTTWATWKELHPDTKVMTTGGLGNYDNYNGYYMSDKPGVIGQAYEDDRLHDKTLVVGRRLQRRHESIPDGRSVEQPSRERRRRRTSSAGLHGRADRHDTGLRSHSRWSRTDIRD